MRKILILSLLLLVAALPVAAQSLVGTVTGTVSGAGTLSIGDGTLDTTFVPRNGPNDTVRCVRARSNQYPFMLGGSFTYVDGLARSRVASINVDDPAVITSQPVNRTVAHGATTSFTVVASGTPAERSTTTQGVYGAAGTLGGILMSWLTGRMLDSQGYTPVLCVMGSLHVLAAVVVLIMVRRKQRPQESGTALGTV